MQSTVVVPRHETFYDIGRDAKASIHAVIVDKDREAVRCALCHSSQLDTRRIQQLQQPEMAKLTQKNDPLIKGFVDI